MINIKSKDLCCGCSACVNVCPKNCISFKEDNEGFLYPSVDVATCVDCGLCEKVCPVINKNEEREPIHTCAVKHPDEKVRLSSSSGGVFTFLAERIIDEGGVVFGARFNNQWEVVHDYTETKEGLAPFRGSKYVQSNIGNSYALAESFLKNGRLVMFTGTPCQISGLKKYLGKEYDNLLAVDVVCHGVPSPMIWRKYLEEVANLDGAGTVTSINFREKSTGWKNYSVAIDSSRGQVISKFSENDYMRAFLLNLSIRPSCYNCHAKAGCSGADLTIGDFWGIENMMPEYDDDKGVSIVLVGSSHGLTFLTSICGLGVKVDFCCGVKGNPSYHSSVKKPINRDYFFSRVSSKGFVDSLRVSTSSNLICRMRRLVFRKIHG